MKKIVIAIALLAAIIIAFVFQQRSENKVKIGVSIGAMNASRWVKDKAFIDEYAKANKIDIEVLINLLDSKKTQDEECIDLINKGISVLILTPRDAYGAKNIITRAKEKGVRIISYDRIIMGDDIDLLVTFDTTKIGEEQAKYLVEKVDKGNYIVFAGDKGDLNAVRMRSGSDKYLKPAVERGDIKILLDEFVPSWSGDTAKEMTKKILAQNNNDIAGILAPNDSIARGCIEALAEVGLDGKVAVTGMDADVQAVKRIIAQKQDITVFKDIRTLAERAVQEAVHLALDQPVNSNAEFDNKSGSPIKAFFEEGRIVTIKNINKVLIDSGYLKSEDVY